MNSQYEHYCSIDYVLVSEWQENTVPISDYEIANEESRCACKTP